MRRFVMIRTEDLSGVSGTGQVLEGVEFENGKVAICWSSKYGICSIIDNIHTLEKVHGHGGKSYVQWIDPPSPEEVEVQPIISESGRA